MRRFRRNSTELGLEPELRTLEDALHRYRPLAPRELLTEIAGPPAAERTPAPSRRPQLLFAAGLTVALLGAIAAVGGVSYAATAVTHAARVVLVTHVQHATRSLSAGGDQYKPGYGFGDPNHNHDGPPGLAKKAGDDSSGAKAPPTQTKQTSDGKATLVSAAISVDEQAALYFSVLDADGNQLLLTQQGSNIGGGVQGPQAKTIHYVMLVPRAIPVRLRIPKNLLVPGQTYVIRVIAVDAQGNKTRITIPFTA